jgi:hypothetical protein
MALAQDSDMGRLTANLRNDDFRVRTQAALALGASQNAKAIAPLCNALGDENTTVRAAAAAALGRLSLGGEDCLEKRLASESTSVVKSAVEKALEQLDGGEPVFTPASRYYIALSKLADKSGRKDNALERVVRAGMKSAGSALDGVVFAPFHESQGRAKERLAKHPRVKGFYLSARLPPFEYTDGSLTVRLEVAMFSYPDKTMIGNYSVRLTQPDVAQADPQSENELVSMAAERAIEKFAHIVPTLL